MSNCVFILLFLLPSIVLGKADYSLVTDMMVSRTDCSIFRDQIFFCGTSEQARRLEVWLNDILKTSIGRETYKAIELSNHKLAIIHSIHAISTAGKTLAPLTSKLSNGLGEDIVIMMNFDMPDSGSHIVTGVHPRGMIPFTARQNFMHELSHARHKMNGSWWPSNSEGQAIADENIYRKEEAELNQSLITQRDPSGYDEGLQVWFN